MPTGRPCSGAGKHMTKVTCLMTLVAVSSWTPRQISRGHNILQSTKVLDMTTQDGFVQVNEITKSYKGISALNGISLEVARGEILGLIGPNGAGKTTLIGCILGLLKPDSGTVSIDGKPPTYLSVRRMTGYVPERPDFEHWMTARQFLTYHHGLADGDPSTCQKDVQDALEIVELQTAAWDRRLKTYSRGMLQRLNIAQLMIGKPQLMLLDEPTLGLDPTGVAVVRNVVNRMRDDGATAIINSHQLDEIERLCDRVAFIRQGQIGSIETLKGGQICNYVLYVKCTSTSTNGDLASAFKSACLANDSQLCEIGEDYARIKVADKYAAAATIRELVLHGVEVEEAFPERMRLEELFSSNDSSDSG